MCESIFKVLSFLAYPYLQKLEKLLILVDWKEINSRNFFYKYYNVYNITNFKYTAVVSNITLL